MLEGGVRWRKVTGVDLLIGLRSYFYAIDVGRRLGVGCDGRERRQTSLLYHWNDLMVFKVISRTIYDSILIIINPPQTRLDLIKFCVVNVKNPFNSIINLGRPHCFNS